MFAQLAMVLLCGLAWRSAHAQSMDQIIQAAMASADSDFIQDDSTVLVELDILYTREEWDLIQKLDAEMEEGGDKRRKKRKAIRYTSKRWHQNIIPYQLAGGTFTSSDMSQINAALDDWMRYTCLTFRQKTSADSNYLYIQNGAGCSSYVGMSGGSQPVNLAPGCRGKGVIIHELGHAIGFHHEQTRTDRDQYVRVLTHNIVSGMEYNFQRHSAEVLNDYGVPYDYTSVMHYGEYAFTSNGQPTIQTIDSSKQHLIGNRYGHSFRDIKLANIMYSCGSNCPSKTCPGEGFVGKDCKCWCPGDPVKECSGGGGSGVLQGFKKMADRDCVGGDDLATIENTTPEICASGCLGEPDCVAFDFNRNYNSCFRTRLCDTTSSFPGVDAYILQVMEGFEKLADRDCVGGDDLATIESTTPEICASSCLSEPDCVAFDFNRNYNSCFRTRLCDTTSSFPGVDAYILQVMQKFEKLADSDCVGGDDLATIENTTPEICARSCLSAADCIAFDFNKNYNSCFRTRLCDATSSFLAVDAYILRT